MYNIAISYMYEIPYNGTWICTECMIQKNRDKILA